MADYSAIFQEAGKTYNVDPNLLRAVVNVESGGNPNAVSEVGAQGVAQLMPATAKSLGVKNAFDPRENIFGAAKLLDENLTRYGNANDAILAYHGGTDQKNWGPKTRAYLEKVTNAYQGNQGTKMASTVNTLGDTNAPDAFSSYFSGDTKAAPQQADAFTAYFGSPGEAKAAPVSQTPAQKPQQAGSALDELGRQIGLTARAGATGISALPTMAGDALNSLINMGVRGVNNVAGTNIPQLQMPSQVTQQAMNAAGLPQPQNATERVVQDVASAMAGTGGQYRLGQSLMNVPAAQGIGAALTTAPGTQLAAAMGGAAGSGATREAGGGIGAQLGAGLVGATVPVATSAGVSALGRALSSPTRAPISPSNIPEAARDAVKQVSRESGTAASIADERAIAEQLLRNPAVDPKAAVRANDFRELGIDPTLGQITRDPSQYARERNIRGLQGVGDPLLARLSTQNNQLQGILDKFRGSPLEPYQAGNVLTKSLSAADDAMSADIRAAYSAARQSTGKDLNVPLSGVAQKYAEVVRDFGDKVPSGVRNNFEALGLLSGTQKKTFTIEDADRLQKVINANYGNDAATNRALGELLKSVKGAVMEADPQGGPFAPAVKLAKERFALQEAVPALKAAAEGTTAPDDFVKRFVINGKTNEVNGLAKLLKETAPDAYFEARAQLGNELNRAAFGTNIAGDKQFSPDRYAEALRRIGTAKLGAFFSPDEVDQIQRVARVGSYINSFPAASAVNTSNTAAVAANLMGRIPDAIEKAPIPGARLAGNLVRSATKGIEERNFVADALAADLSKQSGKMTKAEADLAAKLLLQPAVSVPPVKPGKK